MSVARPACGLPFGVALFALALWLGLPGGPVVHAAAPSAQTAEGSGLPPEQAAELLRSERFRRLASELRCLVCQNQTLADSNAELATDLRNEVLRQMAKGLNDSQIKAHLVDRFGEFVLYRPSFSTHNLLLWAGPAVLAAIGAVVLWRVTRRRPPEPGAGPIARDELQQLDQLLGLRGTSDGDGPRTPPPGPQGRG